MRYVALSFALPTLFFAQLASAQVLITELQPSPVGPDNQNEWIELQNTSSTAVSIEGWGINDYTGMNETETRWAFPAGSVLQPGQVIIVSLTSAGFASNYSFPADYELANGMDDAMVPNLIPDSGTSPFGLNNGAQGDAVFLRDAMGTIIDAMEYGNVDRSPVGSPASGVAGEGQSWIRVNDSGNSFADFVIASTPEPGEPFETAAGPTLAEANVFPQHVDFALPLEFSVTATDTDGISEVSVYVAIATSSTGNAPMNYTQITMTSTDGQHFDFMALPGELDPTIRFADPSTFHDRYVRWYFEALDEAGNVSTSPADATQVATNTEYGQRNVMPSVYSPIAEVVATDANLRSRWGGHSAKITGTVIAQQSVLSATRMDFPIEDSSGRAIRVFGPTTERIIRIGDKVAVSGEILQFRGSMELVITDENAAEIVGQGGPVTTATVTIAELLERGEELEAKLVFIRDATFMGDVQNWPGRVQDTATITDPSGATLAVKVVASNDLAMAATPQYGFDIRGVVTQFTTDENTFTGGYQLFPRGRSDVLAKPAPQQPDAGGMTGGDAGGNMPGADAGGNMPGADAGVPSGPGGGTDEGGCNCNSSASGSSFAGLGLMLLGLALIRRKRN